VVFTLVDLIGAGLAFLIGGRVRLRALGARSDDMSPADDVPPAEVGAEAQPTDQDLSSSSR
jgi:hypothetical protein